MFFGNVRNPPCRSGLFASAASSDFSTVLPAPRDWDLFSQQACHAFLFEIGGSLHIPVYPIFGKYSGQHVTVWNAKAYRCFSDSEVDNRVADIGTPTVRAREPAGTEAQLARVRQKQKSLARRPSGHESTQCEGEGAAFCGLCGHSGNDQKTTAFTTDVKDSRDLGQFRKRPRIKHISQKQYPCKLRFSSYAWSTQSGYQGSKSKALSARCVCPTAKWDTAQDADQWSSRKKAN